MEKKIVFNENYCKSCGLCVLVCPANVIFIAHYINGNGYRPADVVDQEHCISCMKCAQICPDSVITIYKPEKNKGIVEHIIKDKMPAKNTQSVLNLDE